MNCIFMGTPLFGKYILERLVKIVNIKLVLCQPDKPSGRNQKVEARIARNQFEIKQNGDGPKKGI